MRLDVYLVSNNLFDSREKATFAIKSGGVTVNDKVVLKPSTDVIDQIVKVVQEVNPFVSRGGFKLDHAIKSFELDFNNKIVLDIGASTGGFTDVALQNGAKKVVAVDVGSNQLHEKIKSNPKVESHENLNILDYDTTEEFDYLVMDVSFVSIKSIIPNLLKFLNEENYLIALIKPQYELGKVKIKNGVVKDKKIHLKVINETINSIKELNLNVLNLIESPITGKMGNKEYLILVGKSNNYKSYNINEIVSK
ncbi:MAG: TlyA family RNA methyltransferase [bacterium]